MNGANVRLPSHPTIPTLLTSLVGRKREIVELEHLLTTSRLVSLVGAGGCGKTRLAHAVALRVESEFADGVCWVELAQVNDPVFVAQTIAKALQISEQPSLSFVDALCEKLAQGQLLLVLDNCEHLLAACAGLVESLLQATTIQVMTTSREPLGVTGEMLYPMPPLRLPAPDEALAAITQCDAIQLFVERARSIRPSFALTAENAATVTAICRQVDGLPLAIELASARVNVLSVQQIQQRLTHPFDLLVSATRTDQRHRTLRAAIDWSYALLLPNEQLLLQRLSVFVAGFTLSTVEAACAWGELSRPQMLDLLTSLVNKSLVVVETIQGREARYRVLETIRQYASEKLAAAGEWATTHDRYLESFLGLTEEIAPKLYASYQQLWMHWMESEHDNLRVALTWALESGRIEIGLRMAVALCRFWEVRGYVQEGLTWFERLFAGMDEPIALAVHVNALTFAAFLAHFLGQAAPTLAYARTAVGLVEAARAKGKPLLVMALSGLSSGYEAMGDFPAAFATHERTLQLLRAALPAQATNEVENWSPDDELNLGMTVMVQGNTATELGDHASAHRYLDESLTLARAANDPLRIAFTFYFLGNLAYCEQQYAEAQTQYEQSVQLFRQIDATRDLTGPLQNLGHACLQLGEVIRAQALFQESMTIHQTDQNRLGMVECLLGFAAIAILQGLPAAGVRLLAAAEAIGWRRAKSSWAVTRKVFDHYRAQARHALSAAEFEAEQAAGQVLSLAEACAYAQQLPLNPTPAPASREKPDGLTEREREVVVLISLGKSNSEIAAQLVLSKRTVEKHVANIFAKSGLTHRAQIVLWALDNGLTGAPDATAKPT